MKIYTTLIPKMFIITISMALNQRKYLKILLLSLIIFASPFWTVNAQQIDSSILSNLSDEEIELAMNLVESQSIEDTAETSLPEISESLLIEDNEIQEDTLSQLEDTEDASIKFGYDFFNTIPTSTSAVGDLPLPNDYRISIKDQFTIILSGSKDDIFDLNVKLDGTILFPEIGSISVVGDTLGEVKNKLTNMINQTYIGVNVDLSIKNLSAKKITIVGAVKTPGTYLVNPFSTITSALAYSGGVSDIGTLRKIKLIKANGDIYYFDLYDLLIFGDRTKDMTIDAGDTILINAAEQFVTLKGAINRAKTYEVLENDKMEDLISFGLGFSQLANKSKVLTTRFDSTLNSYLRYEDSNLESNLEGVIEVEIFPFNFRTEENILVLGAISEPGQYYLDDFSTLEDLINELEFVNVYPWLGVVESFDSDNLKRSTQLFSLKDRKTYEDIKLVNNSSIYFFDLDNVDYTFLNPNSVSLIDSFNLSTFHDGDIYTTPIYGEFSVKDIIDFLGLDMSTVNQNATYLSPISETVVNMDYRKMSFTAEKFNSLQFRSPINNLINVEISGALDFPGIYVLNSGSSLLDLYEMIGGFKDKAFLDGIIFLRNSIRERQVEAIQKNLTELNQLIALKSTQGETVDPQLLTLSSTSVDQENLGRLAGNFSPNSINIENIILQNGYEIIIPEISNTISVIGEVLNPTTFLYEDGLNMKQAVEYAGGFRTNADKRSIYIINSKGIVVKASRNLFAGNNQINPGDTIVGPLELSQPGIAFIEPVTRVLSDLAFSAAALDSLGN